MNKVIVNMVYIEALLNNELNDFEVIRGYMHYYVAQGRCLHDLHSDLVYQYKKAYLGIKDLEVNQIQDVLIKVKKLVKTHLVNQYGIPMDFITLGTDFKVDK